MNIITWLLNGGLNSMKRIWVKFTKLKIGIADLTLKLPSMVIENLEKEIELGRFDGRIVKL